MKEVNNGLQLALFGGVGVTLSDGRGITIAESFRKPGYKKAGKNWKGKRDAKGYALDAKGHKIKSLRDGEEIDSEGYATVDGERIVTARALTFLPTISKDKDKVTMATETGLTGAALKMHNLAVRTDAFKQAFGIISGEAATGNYILPNNGFKVHANGDISFKMKRTAERIVERKLSDAELIAEAQKRGLIEAAPAK